MTGFFGELIGTMVLIVLGVGVVAGVVLNDSKANGGGWIVITMGWGLGVTLGIYASAPFSAAHLNPAVTLGMAAIGEFPTNEIMPYIAGQIVGAFIGAVIVFFAYIAHFYKTEDKETKLGVFATIPAIRSPLANVVTEIIGTFMLVLAILFIGANEFTEGLNPLVVGALIVALGLSLGGPTGYAINPARDLGPRLAHFFLPIPDKGDSDWGYAWVPIAAPILGGVFGALFYKQIFLQETSIAFWIVAVLIVGILIASLFDTKKRSVNF